MSNPAGRYINARVEAALERAFDQIARYQRDGYCTEEDVTAALYRGWGDAVAEAWSEYITEGDV